MNYPFRPVSLVCLLMLAGGPPVRGQDWHFSQFQTNPAALNPALTGVFDGDLRLTVQYRNQWSFAAPYNTFSVSADAGLLRFGNGDYIGTGLQALADRAGDLDYTTTCTNAALAYHKSLSEYRNHYISAGYRAGLAFRYVDWSRAVAFDPEPAALLASDGFWYTDMAMGLNWYLATGPNRWYYVGASLDHLRRPDQSPRQDGSDVLPRRIAVYGGLSLEIAPSVAIQPSAVWFDQGPHREVQLGAGIRLRLHEERRMYQGERALHAGLAYRVQDALVALVQVDLDEFLVGMSYDVNLSRLTPGSRGAGGPELSVVYVLNKGHGQTGGSRDLRLICPVFF